MPVDAHLGRDRRDEEEQVVGERRCRAGGAARPRGRSPSAALGAPPLRARSASGSSSNAVAAADDLDALGGRVEARDVDAQAEPVEQLRPDLALLGIHRADEDEARGVRERDALALDDVDAHRRGVEQRVDEVVVEQVDLVDVEDAAVRVGEQTRLEAALAVLERVLEVERADEPVLGGGDGQLDEARAPRARGSGRPSPWRLAALGAPRAPRVGGIAAEAASLDDVDLGQQARERADGGGLRGALLAPDEDAADAGIDRVEEQRGLERLLADDGREREHVRVANRSLPLHTNDPPTIYRRRVALEHRYVVGGYTERHWNEPHSPGFF